MDMKTALDIWPALPIVIDANFEYYAVDIGIVGALEDRGRIVGISLGRLTQSTVDKYLRLLQQPFPVLTSLDLNIEYGKVAHVNTFSLLPVGLLTSILDISQLRAEDTFHPRRCPHAYPR